MGLVRDRRSEEGHDPFAGVLVDRPLEAVNSVGEDREEALHDLVPVFRVDRLREIHRPLEVGEEDRHLLALAFDGAAGGEDLLGEVLRSVGPGVRWRSWLRNLSGRFPALAAELYAARVLEAAGRVTDRRALEPSAAIDPLAMRIQGTGAGTSQRSRSFGRLSATTPAPPARVASEDRRRSIGHCGWHGLRENSRRRIQEEDIASNRRGRAGRARPYPLTCRVGHRRSAFSCLIPPPAALRRRRSSRLRLPIRSRAPVLRPAGFGSQWDRRGRPRARTCSGVRYRCRCRSDSGAC